jgi:hypothetical protein
MTPYFYIVNKWGMKHNFGPQFGINKVWFMLLLITEGMRTPKFCVQKVHCFVKLTHMEIFTNFSFCLVFVEHEKSFTMFL